MGMIMPTLNSHTHCQVTQADPQAKTWQRVCLSQHTTKTTDKQAKKNTEAITSPIRKQRFRAS